VILTIIAMVIAYTVPEQWSMVMGRERDRQTIFLMKQYARAIKAFQTKNGGLPASLDVLREARQPRLIRGGKWPCPLNGKEDGWILVPPTAIQGGSYVPPEIAKYANTTATSGPTSSSGSSTLIKEASPPDYTGQFVAVRPKASGKSFIAFKGAEDYSEWVYSIQDLDQEIAQKNAAATAP
jgi:type II secretory pathway pseudopilin PulG